MINKYFLFTTILVTMFFVGCTTNSIQKPNKPSVSLINTYFKALSLNDKEVEVFNKEPYIKLQKDGRVIGALGCNNFFGSYKKEENSISFQSVASTKMMCPNIKTEDSFSKVLKSTKTYKIIGESMSFFDENKKEIAKFKAVYF